MILFSGRPSHSLQWRHNKRDGVSNHQPHGCLLNRLFRRRSKKTSNFRVIGLCEGNSPVAGEFPAQSASYAENVSIWWRHRVAFWCVTPPHYTETEMSSFWWNYHHWLHWKLSKWQLPVQPVMKISSKWRHFRFSVSWLYRTAWKHPIGLYNHSEGSI